ncbi:MAG: hypothetical protein ACRDJW_25270 [Thermomicrobiales bacterium]
MVAREEVHRLVDQLTESELRTAERYLAYLRSGANDPVVWAFDHAPEDDEPNTEDEERAVEEAREDVRLGRVYSAEEAKRLLLG